MLFYEFHIYAATHPEFQAETERLTQARYKVIAERGRGFLNEADTKMPMEQFVAVIDAMIDGLICQRHLTPSVVRDEVIMPPSWRLPEVGPRFRRHPSPNPSSEIS